MNKTIIAPSILSADFAKLGDELSAITKAGADWVHIDVMDGHFVPNLTIGADVIKSLRKHSKLPFDVHLMIEKPELYLKTYSDAGADIITVHYEACIHLDRTLSEIRRLGKKAGVSIVPSTPPDVLDYVLPLCDLILVMSVNPGFGGQSFIGYSIEKIRELRYMIDESDHEILLEVDGGINKETSEMVIEAGADVLVAGSSIFKGNTADYMNNINNLRGTGKVVRLNG
jgi:ribulose-phosphate 3-epimerase